MPVLPAGLTLKRTSVKGRSTRYADLGEGPPLVLLHGIIRSLEDWGQVIEPLSKHYRVLAPDLAGFGFSDGIPEYTLEAQAHHVWDFLDTVGIEGPVRLVGNSLGGAVTMTAAVQRPDRIDRVVLVNSAGFGKTVTVAIRALAIPIIGAKVVKPLALRPTMFMARAVESSLYRDQRMVTPERVNLGYDILGQAEAMRASAESGVALGSFFGAAEGWRRELLDGYRKLAHPTLVVWGSHDKILPASHLPNAKRELPAARFHLFQRVGHMPMTEVPEQFLAVVEPFLAEKRQ